MNKETKLATIREKVIAANPSILDLNFGCEVLVIENGYIGSIAAVTREGRPFFVEFRHGSPNIVDGRTIVDNPTHFGILGRPIRLADVLSAYQYFKSLHMGINQSGNFMFSDSCTPARGQYQFTMADHEIIGIREATLNAKWNLLDDDLSHQSEDTINFLAEILK